MLSNNHLSYIFNIIVKIEIILTVCHYNTICATFNKGMKDMCNTLRKRSINAVGGQLVIKYLELMSCINIVNGSLSFLYFEFDTNYIISTLSEYFFICYFDMNLDCNVSLYLIVIFELVILS